MYKLTTEGIQKCNDFIDEIKKRKEELLGTDADGETDNTIIPDLETIEADVNDYSDMNDRQFTKEWKITDEVNSKPLVLKMGKDLEYHHQIKRFSTEIGENRRVVLKEECSIPFVTARKQMATPKEVAKMLNECFSLNKKTEERMYLLCFSSCAELLGVFEVSVGTVGSSCSSPRDFFMKVFALNATNIVVCHNHPSGDVKGSKQDNEFYDSLGSLCKLLCVRLMDFMIVGDNKVYSYATNCVFKVN